MMSLQRQKKQVNCRYLIEKRRGNTPSSLSTCMTRSAAKIATIEVRFPRFSFRTSYGRTAIYFITNQSTVIVCW